MNDLKKLIGFIIVKKNNELFEIISIRKHKIDDDISNKTDIFYNDIETDQIIFKLIKSSKANVIINDINDYKIEYIINNLLNYKTQASLSKDQIILLKNDLSKKNSIQEKPYFNDIMFVKNYALKNDKPFINILKF